MKYVILGAGGVGGTLGAYLFQGKKDVTLIARNEHLNEIQTKGLTVENTFAHTCASLPICATNMEGYQDVADVIFVCVKGYSLEGMIPFIRRISHKDTVVIPLLNIYGTGSVLQEALPDLTVLDGCVYVAAEIRKPGVIWMKGNILKIVYGPRDHDITDPRLVTIQKDLTQSNVEGLLSSNIQKDAFEKFTYISPAATCGLYYQVEAGEMQKEGEIRECFKALIKEVLTLGEAMGITYDIDMVEKNLRLLDALGTNSSTSMQRDALAGKQSEIEGLVYRVLEQAESYGLELPTYVRLASELQSYRAQ